MAAVISSLCAGRVRGATGTVCLCGTGGEGKVNKKGRGKLKCPLKQIGKQILVEKDVVFVMES